MNFHLLLAGFWLFVGLALVGYHWLNPEEGYLRPGWLGISPGWLIMILAAYNMVRWWSSRAAERNRLFEEEVLKRRDRARYSTIRPDDEYNPQLDFSKQAPENQEGLGGPKLP